MTVYLACLPSNSAGLAVQMSPFALKITRLQLNFVNLQVRLAYLRFDFINLSVQTSNLRFDGRNLAGYLPFLWRTMAIKSPTLAGKSRVVLSGITDAVWAEEWVAPVGFDGWPQRQ